MANFTPTKKQVSDFNNGIKYVNKVDTPSADDFNNVIESQLYSQNFAESIADTPDTSEASQVGVPSVTLIDNIKNGVAYKKFKFANMKGDPGGVAPVENSQSNNTKTVPSSKLLKESSFARVYREATEIPGITYPVAIGDLVKAIMDANISNCYLCIAMNAATETKVTGLPVIGTTPQTYGTLTIITGSSALRMRIEYNRETNNNTTLKWIGSLNKYVTPYRVTWKQVIDDSSAQKISGVKEFTASPIVPTTPSGPSAAVAKSYVDGLTAQSASTNLIGNAYFAVNTTGLSEYTTINQYTCDLWLKSNSSTIIKPSAYSFQITPIATSSNTVIARQLINFDFTNYVGRGITASGLANIVGSGSYQITLRFYSDDWSTQIGNQETNFVSDQIVSVSTVVPSNCKRASLLIRAPSQIIDDVITVKWIDVGLRAYPVLFVPRTIEEELVLCHGFVKKSDAETITGVKTFTASPIVPSPSGPSAAVNKSYVDSLTYGTVYDKVIRTQAEFDALFGSANWLGATSVALVGQFTLSTPNNSGIKIPATVKQIHGFNSAKITITNFSHSISTAKGGLWYDTAPTTNDYSIRDLEVSCTATNGNGYGFRNCINLSNCKGTGTATDTGSSGYGFGNCKNLSNCTGAGTGSSGYGFFYIDYAVNCKDGGSSTGMWDGNNKNISVETCRKTPVFADNTTLNT